MIWQGQFFKNQSLWRVHLLLYLTVIFCKKSKAKFLKNVGIVKKLVLYYIFNLLLNVPNFLKNCNNYVTYAHYFTLFKKYLASNIMVPFFCHIKRSCVKKNSNSSADFDLAFFYIIIMLKLESDFKDFIRHFFPWRKRWVKHLSNWLLQTIQSVSLFTLG